MNITRKGARVFPPLSSSYHPYQDDSWSHAYADCNLSQVTCGPFAITGAIRGAHIYILRSACADNIVSRPARPRSKYLPTIHRAKRQQHETVCKEAPCNFLQVSMHSVPRNRARCRCGHAMLLTAAQDRLLTVRYTWTLCCSS